MNNEGLTILSDYFSNITQPELNNIQISGIAGSEKGLVLKKLKETHKGVCVVIVPGKLDAEKLIKDIEFFQGVDKCRIAYFPPYNLLPFKSLSYHNATAAERIRLLYDLSSGDTPDFFIVTSDTLIQRLMPKKKLSDYVDIIMEHEEIDVETLVMKLIAGGYTRTSLVEEPGDFSLRGGIIDIFSPAYGDPVRIELFGDMVESVRFFSASTQRQIKSTSEAIVVPAKESVIETKNINEISNRVRKQAALIGLPVSKVRGVVDRIKGDNASCDFESLLPLVYSNLDTLYDYFPENALHVLIEPDVIKKNIQVFRDKSQQNFDSAVTSQKLAVSPESLCLDWLEISQSLNGKRCVSIRELNVQSNDQTVHFSIESNSSIHSMLKGHAAKENLLTPLIEWLHDKRNKRFLTLLTCSTKSQAERLKQLLMPYGIEAQVLEYMPDIKRTFGQIVICHGQPSSGFVWADVSLAVITEDEIFGDKKRIRRRSTGKKGKELLSFDELNEGDFVVHTEHGIGRYEGLEKIFLNGITSDYLHLKYKDEDTLYLPVDRMGMIQKYMGIDGYTPVLDKMGGKTWDKIKEKAKKEVEKMAGELLKLYAERKVKKGYQFSEADNYFKDFEAGFPYEETVDQLSAIDDVLADMEQETSMDRLVCGDVGYGKTEVALRAAFKAVNDGKQVAVLVPTTVLAEQHYKTFTERFIHYPVTVEGLSRFRTSAEQRSIVSGLASGKVDIVVGTHRLLSKDIAFKDLGLIVIDEEQRFGVRHKERLKQLRATVDVLTLTATPIPRTLHMSMTGIRDISVISTPPEERQAIITYISEFDDTIISDAIRKELGRNGQIFFIHNTIKSIDRVNEHIKKLVPELRSEVAHGQMGEKELEKVMLKFVNRQLDMLVCTTIVESGLDIPAANTMFINRADKFGLSQMYQLRGRIGRSDEQAYAYLFIPEESSITKDARKRLRVLMENSDLGSGFQIAMSDLQIRGGGAALGASQSGHIAAVGYEMFLKLMENAISDLKGEPAVEELEPEININLSAYIPEDYIREIDQRLILYRRLAGLRRLDALSDMKAEITERYGKLPVEAQNILLKIMLKILAVRSGIKRLDISGQKLTLYFSSIHQKNPHGIIELISSDPDRFELTPDHVLKVTLPKGRGNMMVAGTKKILKEIAQHVNG